jgi:hypothetical protein
MSKLIEKLTKSRQAEPQPMGFMLSKAATEKSRLQLIAVITTEALEKYAQDIAKADAVIFEIAKADDISSLEKAVQLKDGPTPGARLRTGSAGLLKKTLNAGCDFIIFTPQSPFTVTKDEKLGRILELETGLSDVLLRTVGELPVDAVIALEKAVEETLTVNRLMDLQRLLFLINKPLLVNIPPSFSTEELQALYDIGITGVIVEITGAKAAEKLADLRQAIENLKKTAPRKKDKMSAILPRLQPEVPQAKEEEEEEEEEE